MEGRFGYAIAYAIEKTTEYFTIFYRIIPKIKCEEYKTYIKKKVLYLPQKQKIQDFGGVRGI